MRFVIRPLVVAGVAALAMSACGGDAESTDGESKSSGGSGGGGGSGTDPECYDECIKKGADADTCEAACTKDGSGGSGGSVDCYDDCIKKGEDPEVCAQACSGGKGGSGGDGGSGAMGVGGNTGHPGGFGGTMGGSGGSTGGSGGKIDPEREKPCVECMYDRAGTECAAEAEACEKSLACQQLQWCPSLCGSPDCLEECNDIIPTGVAPLSALVQCAACSGGPCAEECQGAAILAYCN